MEEFRELQVKLKQVTVCVLQFKAVATFAKVLNWLLSYLMRFRKSDFKKICRKYRKIRSKYSSSY